jgi:hypothetical protein
LEGSSVGLDDVFEWAVVITRCQIVTRQRMGFGVERVHGLLEAMLGGLSR